MLNFQNAKVASCKVSMGEELVTMVSMEVVMLVVPTTLVVEDMAVAVVFVDFTY